MLGVFFSPISLDTVFDGISQLFLAPALGPLHTCQQDIITSYLEPDAKCFLPVGLFGFVGNIRGVVEVRRLRWISPDSKKQANLC